MPNITRTTISLPEDLLWQAKMQAVKEKTTLSAIVRAGLKARLKKDEKREPPTPKKDPLRYLGVFRIGITAPYKKRSELYEEHIKRKMGL